MTLLSQIRALLAGQYGTNPAAGRPRAGIARPLADAIPPPFVTQAALAAEPTEPPVPDPPPPSESAAQAANRTLPADDTTARPSDVAGLALPPEATPQARNGSLPAQPSHAAARSTDLWSPGADARAAEPEHAPPRSQPPTAVSSDTAPFLPQGNGADAFPPPRSHEAQTLQGHISPSMPDHWQLPAINLPPDPGMAGAFRLPPQATDVDATPTDGPQIRTAPDDSAPATPRALQPQAAPPTGPLIGNLNIRIMPPPPNPSPAASPTPPARSTGLSLASQLRRAGYRRL